MKRVDKGEFVIPGLMIAFLLAYHVQTCSLASEVLLWPRIVTVLLVLLMGAVFLQIWRKEKVSSENEKRSLKKPVVLFVIALVYLGSMPFLGYTLGSFLFLLVTMRFLGTRAKRAFLIALVITLILYGVMILLMDLPLPRLVTPLGIL